MHYRIDYRWQKSNKDPNLWFLEVFKNLSIFIELDWIFNEGEKLPKYQDGLGDRELKSGQFTLQKEVPSRVHKKLYPVFLVWSQLTPEKTGAWFQNYKEELDSCFWLAGWWEAFLVMSPEHAKSNANARRARQWQST